MMYFQMKKSQFTGLWSWRTATFMLWLNWTVGLISEYQKHNKLVEYLGTGIFFTATYSLPHSWSFAVFFWYSWYFLSRLVSDLCYIRKSRPTVKSNLSLRAQKSDTLAFRSRSHASSLVSKPTRSFRRLASASRESFSLFFHAIYMMSHGDYII